MKERGREREREWGEKEGEGGGRRSSLFEERGDVLEAALGLVQAVKYETLEGQQTLLRVLKREREGRTQRKGRKEREEGGRRSGEEKGDCCALQLCTLTFFSGSAFPFRKVKELVTADMMEVCMAVRRELWS